MKFTKLVRCPGCKGTGSVEIVDVSKIRELRVSKGVSLRKMAAKLGFTPGYVSDVELGRRRCSLQMLAIYETL